jgi:hypothetical protein
MLIETKIRIHLPFEPVEVIPTVYWDESDPLEKVLNDLFLKFLWPQVEGHCKEIANDTVSLCKQVAETARQVREEEESECKDL